MRWEYRTRGQGSLSNVSVVTHVRLLSCSPIRSLDMVDEKVLGLGDVRLGCAIEHAMRMHGRSIAPQSVQPRSLDDLGSGSLLRVLHSAPSVHSFCHVPRRSQARAKSNDMAACSRNSAGETSVAN
jgi:hypothetical protein